MRALKIFLRITVAPVVLIPVLFTAATRAVEWFVEEIIFTVYDAVTLGRWDWIFEE